MGKRIIDGREIEEKELDLRYKRAQDLKEFACFYGCATYPFCSRLSNKADFDRLMAVKAVSEKVAKDILLAQGFIEKDFEVTIRINCEESRPIRLDLGD